MDTPRIYVGYDSREDIAWQVCRHSILRHARCDIAIHPLRQDVLRELGLYTRPVDTLAATEFSLTRFLTPYLANSDEWSLFMDCDFLLTTDLCTVFDGLDPAKAAYVVPHDYVPARERKMDGHVQSSYPRKNWSSFILFNGANPYVRALTPAIVNAASPAWLHRFEWLPDDDLIGELPLEWNFLEGEYPLPDTVPNAIHFTNGGPWFDAWQGVAYADLWRQEEQRYRAAIAIGMDA